MAEINGVKVTDEQFMLGLELGRILQVEGYDGSGELDKSKIKNSRALEIIERLEQIHKENQKSDES